MPPFWVMKPFGGFGDHAVDAARHKHDDQYENHAQHEMPAFNEHIRKATFEHIDDYGAQCRRDDGFPSANGAPDHDRQTKRKAHVCWRCEFQHHRVEHPCPPGERRRKAEDRGLVGRHVVAEKTRPVGILADLQGPKLRVGQFGGDGGVLLENGARPQVRDGHGHDLFDLATGRGAPLSIMLAEADEPADDGAGRVTVLALLDNLGKGASGTAVQNLNLMTGADEGAGL